MSMLDSAVRGSGHGPAGGAAWAGGAGGVGEVRPIGSERWSPPPVDFAVVSLLRAQVADRLEQERQAGRYDGYTSEDERVRAVALVGEALEDWIEGRAREGQPPPSTDEEQTLREAVLAALFGLGRLQPLIEREDVENIHIHGHDHVALELADGRLVFTDTPVADSDADLVTMLSGYASRMGQTAREFSVAHPILNLRLPAGGPLGARLAAVMEVADRPRVAIRRHRLVDIDLDDLLELRMVDGVLHAFLRAAVRAGKNMVITGAPGAGKTTLMRALANEIPPTEHLVTVEDEYELGLHVLPERHFLVTPLEGRVANAEGAGEITMYDLLKQALRHSPSRVLVGEVRGGEVTAMLQALSNGAAGGMCTLHARSASATFNRIAQLAQLSAPPLPVDGAWRFTADALDLVVHVGRHDTRSAGGRLERFVAEVIEVGEVGDSGAPDVTHLFTPRPDGRAAPQYAPTDRLRADLQAFGFDPQWLEHPGGTWDESVPGRRSR